jgi:hypothetical protein
MTTSTQRRAVRGPLRALLTALAPPERASFEALKSPPEIQALLDAIPYSTDHFYRSPARVLRERRAHCFDGALLAAAALRQLGDPPLLVDIGAERDDDHLLAVFRRGRSWGAIAKSNFVGLRYREPVYRSVRELVMSYFEVFFNVLREKTMRSYTTPPLDLRAFDAQGWMTEDPPLEEIADALDRRRQVRILRPEQERALSPVDDRSFAAGMQGADADGLWAPPQAGPVARHS